MYLPYYLTFRSYGTLFLITVFFYYQYFVPNGTELKRFYLLQS